MESLDRVLRKPTPAYGTTLGGAGPRLNPVGLADECRPVTPLEDAEGDAMICEPEGRREPGGESGKACVVYRNSNSRCKNNFDANYVMEALRNLVKLANHTQTTAKDLMCQGEAYLMACSLPQCLVGLVRSATIRRHDAQLFCSSHSSE